MTLQSRRYAVNFKLAKTKRFQYWAIAQLQKVAPGTVVRLHVSGDFFSAGYVKQWHRIIAKNPHLTFYYYTRSWRVKSMVKSLEELAQLPNVVAWYSVDRDGIPPTLPPKVRTAYLQIEPDDMPSRHVDLVFRDYPLRKQVRKKLDGQQVCPHENGITSHLTCEQCKICTTEPREQTVAGRTSLAMI